MEENIIEKDREIRHPVVHEAHEDSLEIIE